MSQMMPIDGEKLMGKYCIQKRDYQVEFISEYLMQVNGRKTLSADPDAWTYNQRWSPGRKYLP